MAQFFKPKKSPVLSDSAIIVTIESLDANGRGVARFQHKPVFVSGALPHETVKIKITEAKSKYALAKVIDVIKPQKERVEPVCQHFEQCGGCDIQHLAYDKQLAFKQQKVAHLIQQQLAIDTLPWQEPIVSTPLHYRRKARIGVQYNKKNQAIVGFRRKLTNQLLPIKSCPILVKPFEHLFQPLTELLNAQLRANSIGHIELISADKNWLIVRQLTPMKTQEKQAWLSFGLDHQLSIAIDDGSNVQPLDEQQAAVALTYQLVGDIKIHFNAKQFIQVNADVNQQMINQAIAWLSLTPNDYILDLFCGLGNFSLPIARRVAQVVGVEGVQSMVEAAEQNAHHNNLPHCAFYQADLTQDITQTSWWRQPYTKVILDPARAGALAICERLSELPVSHILYVSCDPATLARDLSALTRAGFEICKIAIMDMFAQTKHVETMVLLTRQSSK
jgi:23S rRNA (uracil1939-C5)-methyltransferase